MLFINILLPSYVCFWSFVGFLVAYSGKGKLLLYKENWNE